jgi:predicted PurR-regulated permease PerM
VAGLYILIQQLENNLLVPQVMKKALGVNPLVTILSLMVGGKLMGVIGVLLAVPVVGIMTVLGEEIMKAIYDAAD